MAGPRQIRNSQVIHLSPTAARLVGELKANPDVFMENVFHLARYAYQDAVMFLGLLGADDRHYRVFAAAIRDMPPAQGVDYSKIIPRRLALPGICHMARQHGIPNDGWADTIEASRDERVARAIHAVGSFLWMLQVQKQVIDVDQLQSRMEKETDQILREEERCDGDEHDDRVLDGGIEDGSIIDGGTF